jgi:hypothetical protein
MKEPLRKQVTQDQAKPDYDTANTAMLIGLFGYIYIK